MMISFKTFCVLIRRDITIFKNQYRDRLINAAIWVCLNIVVFQYVFAKMGMDAAYGAFMVCGNIISNGLFDIMGNVARFISDLEGDKAISYDLTLPLPHWLVLNRIALTSALQAMVVAVWIIPLAKIILGDAFSFAQTSWLKVGLIFVIVHLLYGYFSLIIASFMRNLWDIDNIWCRVIFPLWWLGGFQFSWKNLHDAAPLLSYFALVNPLVMCFEGIRAAFLGQEGYISFWICFFTLVVWTFIVAYIGTRRMMHRLDCV